MKCHNQRLYDAITVTDCSSVSDFVKSHCGTHAEY